VLSPWSAGTIPRVVLHNSTRPITEPKDVEGPKVRVMNNDLFVGMVESLQRYPPMAFAEVLQSLKTGASSTARKTTRPSYESTSHQRRPSTRPPSTSSSPRRLVMSKKAFDALSPGKRSSSAGRAARADLQRTVAGARGGMAVLEEGGVEINTIDDKGPFQDAT
jgi:TRAP-type C4-dicarboxylate transport system substrate-binding protein